MKKMTQAQGFNRMCELHRQLWTARQAKDQVAIDELEKALEALAD